MNVEDYYQQGKRWWLREKRGKEHALPVHHKGEQYLDDYRHSAPGQVPFGSGRGSPQTVSTRRRRSAPARSDAAAVAAWPMSRLRCAV